MKITGNQWVEMLNKNKRYICGEEIDISKGEEDYYKTLKHWRKKIHN